MSSRASLPSGSVHVRAYTRSGPHGPVDVSEHDRSAPDGDGLGSGGAVRSGRNALPAYLSPANVRKARDKMGDYLAFFRQNAARDRAQGVDNGWQLAADHLAHFLDGTGTPVVLSSAQVSRMPALVNAEEIARRRFEDTFTARTRREALNVALGSMTEGEILDFDDHWDTPTDSGDNRPGDYAAIGRSSVRSEGTFRAIREGRQITIVGDVTHRLGVQDPKRPGYYRDPYDLDAGQPGSFPAVTLEHAGMARRFDVTSGPRRQSVVVRVRAEPGGRLDLDGSPVWGLIR
jgi:hypothetical protein